MNGLFCVRGFMLFPVVLRKVARKVAAAPAGVWVLAAVAVAFAVTVAVFRRREGWTFRGEKSLNAPEGLKHRNFIWNKCSTGTIMRDIMANDDWDYMAKYKEADVLDVCFRAANSAKISARTGGPAVSCGGRKGCTVASLKARRPCMNKKNTKCCAFKDGKTSDCVKVPKGVDAMWSTALNKDSAKCSRAECPDFEMRGDYPCLDHTGARCCNGVSGMCKDLESRFHKGATVKKWKCTSADGQDRGTTTVDWGFTAGDAGWACNAWVSACGGTCTATPA